MAAVTQEKDKKKLQKAASKPKAAGPETVAEKTDIASMLRPDKAGSAGAMAVGSATDKTEKEADKVAEAVMKTDAAGETAEASPEGSETGDTEEAALSVMARGPPTFVRRSVDQTSQPSTDSLTAVPTLPSNMGEVDVATVEEADLGDMSQNDWSNLSAGESISPKRLDGAVRNNAFTVSASIGNKIVSPTEPGSPLSSSLQTRLQNVLRLDLSAVRTHSGREATALCEHIGAKAFAYRNHIWVRSSSALFDTKLMAHEVAHTVQQGAAKPLRQPAQSRAPPKQAQQLTTLHQLPQNRNTVRRLAEGEDDPGVLARGAERLADRLDSYGVLKVLIGRRLFTGETQNPSATDFVGAFMKFVGAEETFDQMKQSGSLEDGFSKIKEGLVTHNITWDRVQRTFRRAEDEFDWWSPIESFTQIFGPFFNDVVSYGAGVLKIIAEIVAEAFVVGFGPMGRSVWEKIKAIGDVIGLVLADPMAFAMNLIRAVSRGIEGFGERIWTHIKSGLLAWVLGPFAAMGITLPETLDLKGIISVVLQVLGLTYPQLRPRIVRAMNPNGEIKVSVVERLIEVINILRTEGLAGIWRKVLEYVENLQLTVINGIRDWVVRAVVQAGIRKLVAWSNPVGALLDILLTIYNLIVFFVEKFQQILDFASSVFDSIGKIARGQLNDAALAVENSLKLTIPVIISFMVRLLGLPDITSTVRRIVTNLRAKVHRAFDRLLEWIIKKVKKLIARLISKFKRDTGEAEMAVNMQGENHTLKLERDGNGRKLVMNSVTVDFTAAHLTDQVEPMKQKCKPPITDTLQPQLEEAIAKLEELETSESQTARQPASNRDTPDKEAARQQLLGLLKQRLETGTDPRIRATKAVEEGTADTDTAPADAEVTDKPVEEDEKEVVEPDLEEPCFRYVIIMPEVATEGYYGPWNEVQAQRAEISDKIKQGGEDPRWLIELDHNPEHQIMWRLAFLDYRDDPHRDVEEEPKEGPMFPQLRQIHAGAPASGSSRDRNNSDRALAMAIRYDAHRQVPNTQSTNVSDLNALIEFDEAKKVFKPKAEVEGDPFDAATWWGKISAAANEHAQGVISAYEHFGTNDHVAPATVAAVKDNAPKMVENMAPYVTGEEIGELRGAGSPGWLGGVGMQEDPVGTELESGTYEEVKAKVGGLQFKSTLDVHHMIEQSVLNALKPLFSEVRLTNMIKEQEPTYGDYFTVGTQPYDTYKAKTDELKENEAFAGFDFEAEWRRVFNASGFDQLSVFADETIEPQGFAVAVLHQTNMAAGSTPTEVSEADGKSRLATAFGEALTVVAGAIESTYNGISGQDFENPEDASAAMTQARLEVRNAAKAELNVVLKAKMGQALEGVLDTASTTAHATFQAKQQASYDQIFPVTRAFEPGSEAERVNNELFARWEDYSAPTKIIEENKKWVKA